MVSQVSRTVLYRWAGAKGITETLASILNRTTSLLPNALFASLGMSRADGDYGDAKHVSQILLLLVLVDTDI